MVSLLVTNTQGLSTIVVTLINLLRSYVSTSLQLKFILFFLTRVPLHTLYQVQCYDQPIIILFPFTNPELQVGHEAASILSILIPNDIYVCRGIVDRKSQRFTNATMSGTMLKQYFTRLMLLRHSAHKFISPSNCFFFYMTSYLYNHDVWANEKYDYS